MSNDKNAVILAAGEGKRLRPFTLSQPKCFAQVNRISIIDNALSALSKNGCQSVTIVVGHLSSVLEDTLGSHQYGMSIKYARNAVFAETNSMYSLAIGLRAAEAPCWVLEGDVFFQADALPPSFDHAITWVADSSSRNMDGSYVEADNGFVGSVSIVRDTSRLTKNQCKSAGILALNNEGRQLLIRWLDAAISENRVTDYYDLIIARNIPDYPSVAVHDIAGKKWFEIDTPQDLLQAGHIFSNDI